jgi:hypothetical protein
LNTSSAFPNSPFPQFHPRSACSRTSRFTAYQFLKIFWRRSSASAGKPSSCTISLLRRRSLISCPRAARDQLAEAIWLASSVKVSPPEVGFQPRPVSAKRVLPGCGLRSR